MPRGDTHRGVVILSPANVPDGVTTDLVEVVVSAAGYSVVWSLNPAAECVHHPPPNQRERIALELMAAEVRRDGMFNLERAPEQAPFLATKAVGYADALINALNKEPTAP